MSADGVSSLELRKFNTFEAYDEEELDILAHTLKGLNIDDGGEICAQGNVGDCCFILLHGTVQVERNLPGLGVRQMGTLIPGAIFGHLSLIDGHPRIASCHAVGEARVARLERDDFMRLASEGSPFALKFQVEVSRALIRQLRLCNQRLVEIDNPAKSSNRADMMADWLEDILG